MSILYELNSVNRVLTERENKLAALQACLAYIQSNDTTQAILWTVPILQNEIAELEQGIAFLEEIYTQFVKDTPDV